MIRFARYVLTASALRSGHHPGKPCDFAQFGTVSADAATAPWQAVRFSTQHLLASGVAAAASAMAVILATSAACEDATPLQQLHLRMLRQWLTENGATVDAVEFCSTQVRGVTSKLARVL